MVLDITHLFVKNEWKMFEEFIRNARTDRYDIMCSIDAHEKIHWYMMIEAAVVVIQLHQIQQQKHEFHPVQLSI